MFAKVAAFKRKSFGIVAGKETSVDDNAANHPRQSQPHDAPIVPRSPAAAGFPAVHPFSPRGVFSFDKNGIGLLDEIFFWREKVVVGLEHTAAEAFDGEVGELSEILHRLPRRRTFPTGFAQKLPRS